MSTDSFPMWAIELRLFEVTYDSDSDTCAGKQVKRIEMGQGNSADEIAQFYRELLKMPWLSAGLRTAIVREAGISVRKRKEDYEAGKTEVLRVLINERKAQMRAAEMHPHEGIHEAAVKEVAEAHGLNAEALKRRITRLK